MMKILFFALLLTINCTIGIAQRPTSYLYSDSLKHQLSICKEDTSCILIMVRLCDFYRTSKPDTALFYGEKAIGMAQSINFSKGLVMAMTETGRVYMDIGNLPVALKMQNRALQIADEKGLLYEKAPLFGNIGSIYAVLKNYPKTLSYFKKSRQVYEWFQDKRNIAYVNMNIGSAFDNLNQLDSSLYYLQMAYEQMNEIEIPVYLYWYRGMGRLQHKLGNDVLALKYLHQGIQVSRQAKSLKVLAFELNDISSIYRKQNLIDSSIFYAKLALKEAEEISFKQHILIASTQLAELYESIDSRQAAAYYKKAAATRESLFDLGNLNMIALEEENQKEIENQNEIYKSKLKQYSLLAGLGILLIVAFLLYRNNRQKQLANIVLQEQKEKVDKTLSQLKSTQAQLIQSEKLASLGELTAGIAHEMQNPLNFVNNFAEVSTELLDDMQEELERGDTAGAIAIATDLKGNLEKINLQGQRASAIVKGMLEHSRPSTGVKEPTDLNALADEYLRLSYHGMQAKDNQFYVEMETDFDPGLPQVSIIPQDIGRVLLNLINNAFYAVNERAKKGIKDYEPFVMISSKRLENAVEISVKDNGIGIPGSIRDKIFQPFFTTKPTGQGTGLGLSLAYDIITKGHGGALKLLSTEWVGLSAGLAGSEFIITLPVNTNGG